MAALFFVVVLAAVPAIATAQDAAKTQATKTELEEIIVRATRTSGSDKSIPNTVTIFSKDDIDTQRSVSINPSDMLSNLIASYSPPRQKLDGVGESFRGRAPLFLIDGVPQSNPLRDGSRDGFTIDMSAVDEIEVIYGANAIQGLGATGGIINYITVSPPTSGESINRAELGVMSDDRGESDGLSYRASYLGGRRSGNWDFVGSVAYEQRGLFYDGNGLPVGIESTQGDVADSLTTNVLGKIGYEPSDTQRWQLMVNLFNITGDNDYTFLNGDRANEIPTSSVKGDEPGAPYENDVMTVTLNYANTDFLNGKFTGQAFLQDFAGTYGGGSFGIFQDPAIAPVGTLFDQSQNNSEKFGIRLTQRYSDLGSTPIDVIFGADLLEDETKQSLIQTGRDWVPVATYDNLAPFVQLDADIGDHVTLAGGVRFESAELDVPDFDTIAGNRAGSDYAVLQVNGGNPDFSDTMSNAGIVVRPTDALSLYAMYSQGFAMPDVGRVLRAVAVPNTDVDTLLTLEPIVTDNIEVGIEYDIDRFGAKFAWYESDSDYGSRLSLNSDGIYDVNREKTETSGWELSASFAVTDTVSLLASYAALEGEFDSDGDDKVDSDLDALNIGPDRLNLAVDYNPGGRWRGKLQSFTYMDKSFRNAAGNETANFDGYTTVDITASLALQGVDLTFSIANLFDEQYITYYGQAGNTRADRYFAGRGRTLGVRAMFNF
jgi:iron complex outermembrane receptor protein